jgi:CheY-like chemotaxis protein
LVSNAIKFTHHGYVKVIAKIINNSQESCIIQFKVNDTGIGIPADKIDSIFDVFTQADTNTTRNYGGTGLGLAICKKLLHMQNSKLVVKSELGSGSTFTFDLVFKRIAPNNMEVKSKVIEQAIIDLKGTNLLVADDNQINVFVIKQFLNNWGVKISVAENGEEALNLALANDFDIVLMDLHMPIMDGFEATKEILKQKPNTKIIAITATTEDEVGYGIANAGMVGFVMKPFQPEDLAAKITAALAS